MKVVWPLNQFSLFKGSGGGGGDRENLPKCQPFSFFSEMCNRTKELLTSRVSEVLQNLGPANPLMEEVTRHALFCRDHTHAFQGRADILQAIHNYVTGPNPLMPLVIHGESGVGKTSLMAKVVMETQEKNKDRNLAIMYRFCGTTPDSSTGMMVFPRNSV